jgi:hypothetical protein
MLRQRIGSPFQLRFLANTGARRSFASTADPSRLRRAKRWVTFAAVSGGLLALGVGMVIKANSSLESMEKYGFAKILNRTGTGAVLKSGEEVTLVVTGKVLGGGVFYPKQEVQYVVGSPEGFPDGEMLDKLVSGMKRGEKATMMYNAPNGEKRVFEAEIQ